MICTWGNCSHPGPTESHGNDIPGHFLPGHAVRGFPEQNMDRPCSQLHCQHKLSLYIRHEVHTSCRSTDQGTGTL